MNSSAAWNIAWALIAVIGIFALAAGTKRTVSIGVLLVLIPFQSIHTPYASSSVLIAYVLAAVLLIQGGLKVRMLPIDRADHPCLFCESLLLPMIAACDCCT